MAKLITKTISLLRQNVIEKPIKIGIEVKDMNGPKVSGNHIEGVFDVGISLEGGSGAIISGNTIIMKSERSELHDAIENLYKAGGLNNEKIANILTEIYKSNDQKSKLEKYKQLLEAIKTITDLSPIALKAISTIKHYLTSLGII